MTVIVYRDGILAADSLATWSSRVYAFVDKIWRDRDGWLIGMAGDGDAVDSFRDWWLGERIKSAAPKISDKSEIGVLAISPAGVAHDINEPNFVPHPIRGPFFAIGSGAQLATGAMEMGADAEQAVRVACIWDTCCGGDVQILRVIEAPLGQPHGPSDHHRAAAPGLRR